MEKVSPLDVSVREFRREDLADMHHYFFESSNEFLRSIGAKDADPEKGKEFLKICDERLNQRENGLWPRLDCLTVLYKGERIGAHTSTHHEPGKSLIMHAHFFRPDMRGKGIGVVSYVLAIEKYVLEHGYPEIIFKTPIQNKSPMRIKEKLGMKPIGEEIIDWPMLRKPMPAKVYSVTADDLPELRKRAGLT